jgi:hypothetical protein
MYHTIEKRERANRRQALWLAVVLHLGLVAALYLAAGDSPAQHPDAVKKVNSTPEPAAKPRTAGLEFPAHA